jgi:hypothetical protein
VTVDAIATTMELPATTLLVTVNHGGWAHCGEMSRLSEQPFPVQVSSARPLPREFCSPCRSDLIRSTCTSEGLPTLTVFRVSPPQVPADGLITIAELKSRLALALPGIPPEQQLLEWNGKPLGRWVAIRDNLSFCQVARRD